MKLPKIIFGIDTVKAYEDYLARAEKKDKSSNQPKQDIQVTAESDFWNIQGVQYRNGIYQVDLLKILLDNGAARTQDQWASFSEQARNSNGFYTPDMPLSHSLFTALYLNRNDPKTEEIRAFLKASMRNHWLATLTRIRYKPRGKDTIIHNHNLQDKLEIQEDFIGPDEWVKDSTSPNSYRALLGTDNLQEINAVYQWINETDAYLWRLNQRSDSIDERVARFNADSGRVSLGCLRDPQGSNSSLGVRFCAVRRNAEK